MSNLKYVELFQRDTGLRPARSDPAWAGGSLSPKSIADKGKLETRAKHPTRISFANNLNLLQQRWPRLRERISRHLLPADELAQMLDARAPSRPEQIGISPRISCVRASDWRIKSGGGSRCSIWRCDTGTLDDCLAEIAVGATPEWSGERNPGRVTQASPLRQSFNTGTDYGSVFSARSCRNSCGRILPFRRSSRARGDSPTLRAVSLSRAVLDHRRLRDFLLRPEKSLCRHARDGT